MIYIVTRDCCTSHCCDLGIHPFKDGTMFRKRVVQVVTKDMPYANKICENWKEYKSRVILSTSKAEINDLEPSSKKYLEDKISMMD